MVTMVFTLEKEQTNKKNPQKNSLFLTDSRGNVVFSVKLRFYHQQNVHCQRGAAAIL